MSVLLLKWLLHSISGIDEICFSSPRNFENVSRIVLASQEMVVQRGGFLKKGTWCLL